MSQVIPGTQEAAHFYCGGCSSFIPFVKSLMLLYIVLNCIHKNINPIKHVNPDGNNAAAWWLKVANPNHELATGR